jgi:hypothetical protein
MKAAVFLKMKKFQEALSSSNEALQLTAGKNPKGW